MEPSVAIIILNWNNWKDTIECLESIDRINYSNFYIIVVDNNSKDDSVKKIEEYKSNRECMRLGPPNYLNIIKNTKNYGFAEGNNIGIRFSLKKYNPDYILLLNNDTVVKSSFLSEMIEIAEKDDKIAILGPKIYPLINNEVRKTSAVIGMKLYLRFGGLTRSVIDKGIVEDVDLVSGACMLINRKLLSKLGLLDNTYFFGWEDVDICTKSKNLGFRVVGVPNSKICHKIGASYGNYFADNPQILSEGVKNQLVFLDKYASFGQKLTSIPSVSMYYVFIIFYKAKSLDQIKNRTRSLTKGLSNFFSLKRN